MAHTPKLPDHNVLKAAEGQYSLGHTHRNMDRNESHEEHREHDEYDDGATPLNDSSGAGASNTPSLGRKFEQGSNESEHDMLSEEASTEDCSEAKGGGRELGALATRQSYSGRLRRGADQSGKDNNKDRGIETDSRREP